MPPQVWPVWWQPVMAHLPFTHAIEQQALLMKQFCPSAVHIGAGPQVKLLQWPEQHWPFWKHCCPLAVQVGAPHWPLLHCCVQHSAAPAHAWPSGLHGGGWPQVPLLHEPEQQRPFVLQASPSARQGRQVPFTQRLEQHAAGVVQPLPLPTHPCGPHTPWHSPPQHSAAEAQVLPSVLQAPPLLLDALVELELVLDALLALEVLLLELDVMPPMPLDDEDDDALVPPAPLLDDDVPEALPKRSDESTLPHPCAATAAARREKQAAAR